MKSVIATIATTAFAFAAAQSAGDLPTCAQPCVTDATSGTQIGGCNALDITCICSNQDFLNSIACCLQQKCDSADQQTAVAYAKQLCNTAGVQVPDAVTCNGTTLGNSTSSNNDDNDLGGIAAGGAVPAFFGVLAAAIGAALALA